MVAFRPGGYKAETTESALAFKSSAFQCQQLPHLCPLNGLLRDHKNDQTLTLQRWVVRGSEDRKTHKKTNPILRERVQLRRTQNKTVPARRETQMALVASNLMLPLCGNLVVHYDTLHRLQTQDSSLTWLNISCICTPTNIKRMDTASYYKHEIVTKPHLSQRNFLLSNNYVKDSEDSCNFFFFLNKT